jgi:2-C-methyl-D-erythritol 4-phosphate cytidylyltransferase / 2-C-methyl-D-erythritol 2,4-cyclodiphosphate synthase
MRIIALIAAGGRGTRFGGSRPKQLARLGGRTILEHSVAAFAEHPRVAEVLVALPPEIAADLPPGLASSGRVRIVEGGVRRQDSVARAFEASGPAGDLFVIHDAARPLVEARLIDRVVDAAARSGAAIAALPARDTVKLADVPGTDVAHVVETLDRTRVWLAQTPQAFTRRVLEDAIAQGRAGASATDEAALAERAGHTVQLVPGSARNLKITTPDDLAQAEAWLRRPAPSEAGPNVSSVSGDVAPNSVLVSAENSRSPSPDTDMRVNAPGREDVPVSREARATPITLRVGLGYDSHRLVQGRPLVLGGVSIPHSLGLTGHSDADAVCHAITDAVLGAAALGDIGRHFPDSDARWKDAASIDLLRRAVALVSAAGFAVCSTDVVVIAEQPKLAPHIDAIRASLAAVLQVAADAVSIKGKTNEGMGETGRGEAIAVHAVALLARA